MSTMTVSGRYTVAVDESEWQLLRSLREIPPSPLRDRLTGLVGELTAFVANPGCPEQQADGAPCDDVHMSCDRCRQLLRLLDSLRSRLWTK
jgi:hypothetical protein